MGAFMLFDISFSTAKDREKFEKKYKLKDKDILVGEKSGSGGFCAWTMLRNPCLDVVYYMGFMGYADPKLELKECLKEGIKIKFLSWLPINDKDSIWQKERGRWEEINSHEKCFECLYHGRNKKCKDKYCLVNELIEKSKEVKK